ncbi:hypothetical protein Tco_1127498 [Tanacetum coccineum]
MDFEVTDASIQQNPEQMDEEFTTTAYPNVQENLKLPTEYQVRLEEPASSVGTLSSLLNLDKELSFADQFLVEKSQEDEPEKTNTKSERIGELEQHMADLVQYNLALEERLDKHGSRLYKLGNLDIPHQVSKVVDEIVTDVVDWAIQAPLRDRFKDLPEADMKEILHHRMWETKSYEAYEDYKKLYEALEKSMNHDHSDQLLTDLAEARRKKKRRHESPKTPPGSPPHQPPPPPPPAGPSGTSGAFGASESSQLPPPPPPSSTNQKDLLMDADSAPDEQVHSSDDEDIRNDHIPKVNLKQDWWKPLSEEDRPATPEPAWSISSSDMPVLMNNWASALASTYVPPPENSLLAQTGDMTIFMDNSVKSKGSRNLHKKTWKALHLKSSKSSILMYNVSKPLPLGGQPGHVTNQADFFFNKDLEYLRNGSKGGRPALHTSEGDRRAVRTHMRILSVVRIEVFSLYGYDYMKTIVLRRADLNEYILAKRDFKY